MYQSRLLGLSGRTAVAGVDVTCLRIKEARGCYRLNSVGLL